MDLSRLNLTEQTGAGVRLTVKVVPGASRDRIVGELGGALKIAVSAVPERGQANRAIIDLLARQLAIAPARITILHGQSTARKEMAIEGVTAKQLVQELSKLTQK